MSESKIGEEDFVRSGKDEGRGGVVAYVGSLSIWKRVINWARRLSDW